jgi:hypothetical protein
MVLLSMPDGSCHTQLNAAINSSGIVAVIAALPDADNVLEYTAINFINTSRMNRSLIVQTLTPTAWQKSRRNGY